MRVLVIGSGGREHSICWSIKKSSKVSQIFCAPGNAGIASIVKTVNIKADNIDALLNFALEEKIDLTIVGPEQPLAIGIVDLFRENGLLIFGPNKFSSQLESSKEFSKIFMKRNNIPTARFKSFSDFNKALKYVRESDFPLVVKADGLAAGKGVRVCTKFSEAEEFLKFVMLDKIFSVSGEKVVIEEFLEGEEASFFVFTDGKSILPLDSSQDHKRLLDDDMGPNTGGMGAYSPAPIVDEETRKNIMKDIVEPVFAGFKKEKINYTGVLYIGLMIKNKKSRVVEFNCRFGDPETQPLLYRLDSDAFDLFFMTAEVKLDEYELKWKDKSSITVVMAAKGYPGKYETGLPVKGIQGFQKEDVEIFHAGTANIQGETVINGGRVLGVTAEAPTLKEAISLVYTAISELDSTNLVYRKDIGKKGLSKIS
ncbi:MAG: phosphoribosylamine--glycine ligase [Thermodesulfobacteriota bacterium]|nr:MAG: phosphoribosylamine--glycine ligase [Candidatus Dadabacteria bacterium]|tara:strand:+ start:93921 stop:95195 length:1275 start_codon:yes stop_codon:yes gene_type:complete